MEILKNLGESPPSRWTMAELKQRIIELKPELDEPTKRTDKEVTEPGTVRQWVRAVNKAKQRKTDMVELCASKMNLSLSGHETIPVLEKAAMTWIYNHVEPTAEDDVGFGKYAALQYSDINLYYPSYREWIIKTDAEEAGADHRLRRLAAWLRANPVEKTKSEQDKVVDAVYKKKATTSPSTTSSRASVDQVDRLEAMITKLQEEVVAL